MAQVIFNNFIQDQNSEAFGLRSIFGKVVN
jgi:hypothetical protein